MTVRKKLVTGIVVNDHPNVSAAYRRRLRQALYYCRTFGVASHMERAGISESEDAYLCQLLGQVEYVLSVDPQNEEMRRGKAWLKTQISK